ncbi:L,D-transpeptidase family protein [Rhodobium gokarnense]|uniref:Murein L,D-transpeptidase YcbB/YkuD n=1 Tax=Rhodobium gokarnense TaxID=364296 RepID=A0ABT3HFZ2_9HYPH|nr:L,D-transpeptidase family protein [Rhodobium gokarnense]MCW2309321.1 murein L,D-transpeptidase YcbB/YkuD [Rhodobium gokarnense]
MISRRDFSLKAVGAGLGAALAASPFGAAFAGDESPLNVLMEYKRQSEWSDRFDATIRDQTAVKSDQPTLSPETAAYIEQAIQKYAQISARGGWPRVPGGSKLRIGARDRRVVTLRKRLMVTGDLEQSAGLSDTYDSYVAFAVRRFQLRHGFQPDGVVGNYTLAALNVPVAVRLHQLETNLIRVRSMSGFLGDRYVMVNIPAAEIEAVENGRVHSRHTAVVGKIDRQTPLLASKIHELNFNPYWHVPESIIRKDLIPKMNQDPTYLADNKIRIYDQSGNELTAEQINWHTDEAVNYRFRQDPGAINSMGSVKINFYNKHSVYLHDTPAKTLFGTDRRFHSSGCVRVQNVRELIGWLLETTPDWDRARVDEVIRSGERIDVRIKHPVPIYTTYITAWATADGIVNFRDDVYNRDGAGNLAQNQN